MAVPVAMAAAAPSALSKLLKSPVGGGLIGLGGSVLNKLFGFGGSEGFDASKYKNDLVMSRGRQTALQALGEQSIQRGMMAPMAQFRQYAGANRLPVGAVASGLHGFAQKAGQASADLHVGLEEQRHQQMQNYLGMLQRSQDMQAERSFGRYDFTPEIGTLTKALMLYQSGLLTDEEKEED